MNPLTSLIPELAKARARNFVTNSCTGALSFRVGERGSRVNLVVILPKDGAYDVGFWDSRGPKLIEKRTGISEEALCEVCANHESITV